MPATTWTAKPPEVGVVYEYTGESVSGDWPCRILTLASWRESGTDRAIFVALDHPERRGWWTNVWHLELVAWNRNWRKIECTSDDPRNHQGDTCPIHEASSA